jgi:hypothetical protein
MSTIMTTAQQNCHLDYTTKLLPQHQIVNYTTIKRQTLWPLVPKRSISTELPSLVGETSDKFCDKRGVAWSVQQVPTANRLGFLDRSRYLFIQIAPHLSSQGRVQPVAGPLQLKKKGTAGNPTRDLWICSQEL